MEAKDDLACAEAAAPCRKGNFSFSFFTIFLGASAPKNCAKKAAIQSAASAASAKGGCASSRLDHGLKFYVTRGGCASSRLIHRFSDCEVMQVQHAHNL